MDNRGDEKELEFFNNAVSIEEAVPTKKIRKCTAKRYGPLSMISLLSELGLNELIVSKSEERF